jgi:RES domain-containing protein
VSGTLCRAVRARHLQRDPPEPLFYQASAAKGARYTLRGGAAALYLASDQPTAFAEIRDLVIGDAADPLPLAPHEPVTLVYVEIDLDRVLDLTDGSLRRALGISRKAILADWEAPMLAFLAGRGGMPLTQQIGTAAHSTSAVKGILYPSARKKGGQCIVVFPDRIAASDRVASYDPGGNLAQSLTPPGMEAHP